MPFRSQAQRAKFHELVRQGKMKQEVLDEWESATGQAKLPERVAPKPKAQKSMLPRKRRSR